MSCIGDSRIAYYSSAFPLLSPTRPSVKFDPRLSADPEAWASLVADAGMALTGRAESIGNSSKVFYFIRPTCMKALDGSERIVKLMAHLSAIR